MKFDRFSQKQLEALTWWCDNSPHADLDAIICDGAVRSGKTISMGLSFFCWAMQRFDGRELALCGKTIVALRRNVVVPLLPILRDLGFSCQEKLSRNTISITFGGNSNTFYLFGGKDEGSSALIQGSTFAGVLMDEAALMPRSFVEQACARCSVAGSKIWFNCNPEGPSHWFYLEWIKKADERRALYLHFSMEDNPSLSRRIINRYKRLYSGLFYRRFVLGEWVVAQGRIYDFFNEEMLRDPPDERKLHEYAVSCDYGTSNPASFGLWGRAGSVWYRISEYYYNSRQEGRQKTDAEYVRDLLALLGGRSPSVVVVDPSAASFIEALRREGLPVVKARNDVLSGIRLTADLLKSGKMVVCRSCQDSVREFYSYCWNEAAAGVDTPKKENDHAMDDIRYFASTVLGRSDEGLAMAYVERGV